MWPIATIVLLAVVVAAFPDEPKKAGTRKVRPPQFSFLANDRVKVGVNTALGGAVGWLGPADRDLNLVNNWDWGRQIQLSFYSGPTPYVVGDKRPAKHWDHIGWNPVQAGDDYGTTSRVLEHTNDGRTLYTKCAPMQWTLDNEPADCTFETWLTLDGPTVRLRGRLTNQRRDATAYGAHTQELPAIYVNAPYYRLFSYTGDKPWTGGELSRLEKKPGEGEPRIPWVSWRTSECWAALVDDAGYGLGVWQPGCHRFSGGFAGKPGVGGTKDGPCGYIAPNRIEHLDANIVYEFETTFILGTLDAIRDYVTTHSPRPTPPNYRFARDRQGWTRTRAKDASWPMAGEWALTLDEPDPALSGPAGFWMAADAPTLYVQAAFRTAGAAQVFWSTHADPKFSDAKSLNFAPTADGTMRVYAVPLGDHPAYRGAIAGLRFDPTPNGRPGDAVRVRSVGFAKPEP